jgi:hypothetical protein
LHYNRFRYYDPDIGRFVSIDPVGLAGGTNTYKYASNAVAWVDPFGLSPCNSSNDRNAEASSSAAHNAAKFAKYNDELRLVEKANPLVESLRATGELPSNYVTKQEAIQAGWKPGKALENYVPGGQIGGDIFQNSTGALPSAPNRVWFEADVGLTGAMSRSNQPGTRLLYSNDGQLYVTPDHYNTVVPIGRWKP